ncbi:MAG: type II toxin-antitoxin system VapC family toxin [Candidatus Aminicenantes bacterium]
MKYLLDTCVISELIKKEKNSKVVKWIKKRKESSLFISVLTVGEIQKGISKLPDSHKKEYLKTWIDNDLKKRFSGRILEITEEIATSWGEIQAKSESEGKKMPAIDSLIAATAIKNNLTVVTRNEKDIENSGCKSINPWE